MSATATWRDLLKTILAAGDEVRPRDKTTLEVLGLQSQWQMSAAVVACPARKLGHRFMTGEAAWILSGDNRVSTIAPLARHVAQFSDDGLTYFGAYGPPFVDQEGYVVDNLWRDPMSRQAVATLWRPKPRDTRDCPCTVALQWVKRNDRLHCVATMRSSDAWLGVPYDVFSFSMMSAHVLLSLQWRERQTTVLDTVTGERAQSLRDWQGVKLGRLLLTAGSQHLYKLDWERAKACCLREDELFHLDPFDPLEFDHPDELTKHLRLYASHGQSAVTHKKWLVELWRTEAVAK